MIFHSPSRLTVSKALVRSTKAAHRLMFCSLHFSCICLSTKIVSTVPLFTAFFPVVFQISRAQPLRPIKRAPLRHSSACCVYTHVAGKTALLKMSNSRSTKASKASFKGFGRHCSVRGCTYNEKKLCELQNRPCFDQKPTTLKDCLRDPPYRFHFPKNADQKREWLATLQMKSPTKNLYVSKYCFTSTEA